MRIGSIVLVLWLLIGAAAAFQRGYFDDGEKNCAEASTILLTVVAGPLNYLGVNPKADCPAIDVDVEVPQPSS